MLAIEKVVVEECINSQYIKPFRLSYSQVTIVYYCCCCLYNNNTIQLLLINCYTLHERMSMHVSNVCTTTLTIENKYNNNNTTYYLLLHKYIQLQYIRTYKTLVVVVATPVTGLVVVEKIVV